MSDVDSTDHEDPYAWSKAMNNWASPRKGRGRESRKKAEKRVRGTINGGSLTETGRTKQFNFKALPVVHQAVTDAAALEGITMSEWMEKLLIQHLGLGGA